VSALAGASFEDGAAGRVIVVGPADADAALAAIGYGHSAPAVAHDAAGADELTSSGDESRRTPRIERIPELFMRTTCGMHRIP
jgi:hypothetical protein